MAGRGAVAVPLAAVGLVLLLGGCSPQGSLPFVDLSVRSAPPARGETPGGSAEPLRFAVAPVITPRERLNAFYPLLEYLSERLGRPVRYVPARTYAEINEMMKFGSVDLALVCDYPYVLGQEEGYMELLAIPQIRGKVRYRSVVIVPADSPAKRVEDLRGKSFAFSDPISFAGRLAPTYMLWQRGTTPESFFGRTIFTYSHANSIRAVARHLVDGAAVDSVVLDFMVGENPDLARQVRVIAESPESGMLPVVVRPKLDPALRERLRQVLLGVHRDPEGQAALATLAVDRFVPGDDGAYDVVRRMLAEMRRGGRS